MLLVLFGPFSLRVDATRICVVVPFRAARARARCCVEKLPFAGARQAGCSECRQDGGAAACACSTDRLEDPIEANGVALELRAWFAGCRDEGGAFFSQLLSTELRGYCDDDSRPQGEQWLEQELDATVKRFHKKVREFSYKAKSGVRVPHADKCLKDVTTLLEKLEHIERAFPSLRQLHLRYNQDPNWQDAQFTQRVQALEIWREANCVGGTMDSFIATAEFFLDDKRKSIDKHGFWLRAGPWVHRTISLLQRRLLCDEVSAIFWRII